MALERKKPKGASSRCHVNLVGGGQGFSKGSKPRSRRVSGRPEDSSEGATARETAGGFIADGNVRDTFREEKAPKGKIPGVPLA
jgi:hypothetical protein